VPVIVEIPKLVHEIGNCSDSDSDEENWEEEVEEQETKCLFSDEVFPSIDSAVEHLKTAYKFDLAELKAKHSMDFYSYIKVSLFLEKQN